MTIKVAGRRLAVQRLCPARGRGRPDAGIPARGPRLDRLVEGVPARGYANGWACPASSTTAGATGSRSRSTARATIRYLHDEARVFLPAVLRAARRRRGILIGHSDGGTIALLFAAALSRSGPAAIVTEAAHVFVEDITLAGIRAAGRRLCRRRTCRPARPLSWRQDRVALSSLARRLAGARVPQLEHRGRAAARHLPGAGAAGGGTTSTAPRRRSRRSRAVSAGPCETVLLPECGHTPHQQAAEAVLDLMARLRWPGRNIGHG